MHARLPGSRRVVLATLTASLLPLLAGCGPARNQFAPVCPASAILGDASNIERLPAVGRPGGRRVISPT